MPNNNLDTVEGGYFREQQKFTQWWVWLLLISITAIAVYGTIQQVGFGIPFGDNPMSNTGMVIFTIFTFGFLYFNWCITLETKINIEGITIRFVPFFKKVIQWHTIDSLTVVNYGFVGYGIRYGSKYGTVYNTRGNKGLAITFKNGKKMLVGTQKTLELEKLLKKLPLEST